MAYFFVRTFVPQIDINSLTERFIRYVKIDTQSDAESDTFPSSENQLTLGALLVKELKEAGIADVKQDKFGYVIANIPSNANKEVPVILFCSHLDTSPDFEAEGINPIIHKNYDGKDIVLPCDPPRIISPEDFPELKEKTGMDIITSDGTTLLSADNKAGLAELMEAAKHLVNDPGIRHGKIILLFVPDEEIGKDVLHLNVKELKADYGYTIDGHNRGSVNNETFSVGNVKLEITGNSMHTGAGKGLMENSVRIAAEIIHSLPREIFSEMSSGRKGFIHVSSIQGKMGFSRIIFQLRAFGEAELNGMADTVKETAVTVLKRFPRSSFSFSFTIKDKNIIEVLKDHPRVIDNAMEAMRRTGIEPVTEPLRGATTGTGLSFKGLPTANLFTGQHANHSKMEWVCIQDMQKSVETILNLCVLWQESE